VPAIPVEVTVTILSLIGALIGYAFREYRNRVNPLLEIIKMSTTSKRSEKVEVDPYIVEALRDSFYPEEIQPEDSLGAVYDTWNRCDDMRKFWPDTKRDIEAVISATTDADFKSLLAKLLKEEPFEKWLMRLLINSRLDFNITTEVIDSPEIILTWYDPKGEGKHQVWFDLPPAGSCFGSCLDHPAIKDKCMPFILAVSRLHRPGIASAFA